MPVLQSCTGYRIFWAGVQRRVTPLPCTMTGLGAGIGVYLRNVFAKRFCYYIIGWQKIEISNPEYCSTQQTDNSSSSMIVQVGHYPLDSEGPEN